MVHRNSLQPGYLLLEDGTRFDGDSFFGSDPSFGEAVFNTSHTGYQEILTDPSYRKQIMTFTTTHIGNVGINGEDVESNRIQVAGAVVRSLAPRARNWRAEEDLEVWMDQAGAPVLAGADTRAITLHLRSRGAMRAGLFPSSIPTDEALEQVKASPDMDGANLAAEVSCEKAWSYTPDDLPERWYRRSDTGTGLKVAVLDYGVKRNILRQLAQRGCEVTVLPATTTAGEVKAGGYHGVLVSNGPGDPAAVIQGIETVRGLIGELPLFGICLGHQLLSLAAGLETFKLPFGHRGANHPVRAHKDGSVEITSQNHGFAVRDGGLPKQWTISHLNLNDQTIEGLAHTDLPAFSIQYHPEASPGPHEGWIYFDQFVEMMK
ncbi:glutamine-hydrolyzing carbamoyl-phosphate synthase small subunit [bacterium]|nr:glutamine-hydrolyzing carbamoyl-phosphate synthase small subunit [bacterium]